MKRYIIILSFLGLILNIGCEKLPFSDKFLEKAPGVDVTKDSIFKNLEYAERFLWGAYATLPYGINTDRSITYNTKINHDLLENMTDLAQTNLNWGGVYTSYYSGLYNSAAESNNADGTKYGYTSEHQWEGIRRSWIFINNIDKVPGVDSEYAEQLKAEALMIIAIHYAEMYRHFGGVPWIGHAYDPNEMVPKFQRMTAQSTCDSILMLCDRAAGHLPFVTSTMDELDGRLTRAAAMGLKARILLFNASPLFNSNAPFLEGQASSEYLTWHGSYDVNKWKQAADAAKALIDEAESTGKYALYHKTGNSFRKDFQEAYYLRGNGEVLISTRRVFKSPTAPSWAFTFYWSAMNWGSSCVTDDYVKMFPMSDGTPISQSPAYNASNPYINRDPRLYETVLVNGDTYKGRTARLYIGGDERLTLAGNNAKTGYSLRKFLLENNTATSYGSIVHWPYLRLAEIYLTYAEAINEFNSGPNAEAYIYVNKVRNRVGLGNLPAGLSQAAFREAVILERALEFGWEEVRWFDIIRWKKEDVFKKTLHGCDIFRNAGPPVTFTYVESVQPDRYWKNNFSPKWYLSAFPINEVQKGYGLVQNPGWE